MAKKQSSKTTALEKSQNQLAALEPARSVLERFLKEMKSNIPLRPGYLVFQVRQMLPDRTWNAVTQKAFLIELADHPDFRLAALFCLDWEQGPFPEYMPKLAEAYGVSSYSDEKRPKAAIKFWKSNRCQLPPRYQDAVNAEAAAKTEKAKS